VHGYAEFLAAIADADDPEHASMIQWSGGAYDPDAFHPEAVVFDDGRTWCWFEAGRPTNIRSGSRGCCWRV
jgi:hypothetical protein